MTRAADAPASFITDPSGWVFDSLAAGLLVGDKYRLVECVGEGGMATVWVARNDTLESEVAIKFVRTDLGYPNLAERLLQEARGAAKLRDPAIVRIFDYGTTARGDPYIVMERLVGEDLARVLFDSGRMTPIAAVRTLLPIAHALVVAHDHGIVHRDVKPENVFLAHAEDGRVQPKLLDFGVAKYESAGFARLTLAGDTVGSPAYMSPEQARGEEVDSRGDVWSFAVVLYEALGGNLPFREPSYNALMRQIIEDDPTPLPDLAAEDSELWRIVERGLAKPREERWASMRALGAALARWLLERDVHEDLAGGSLVATWLEVRQSWVGPDGVFERIQCSSGPHSSLHTTGEQPTVTGSAPPEARSATTDVPVIAPLTWQATAARSLVPRTVSNGVLVALGVLGVAALVYTALDRGASRSVLEHPALASILSDAFERGRASGAEASRASQPAAPPLVSASAALAGPPSAPPSASVAVRGPLRLPPAATRGTSARKSDSSLPKSRRRPLKVKTTF